MAIGEGSYGQSSRAMVARGAALFAFSLAGSAAGIGVASEVAHGAPRSDESTVCYDRSQQLIKRILFRDGKLAKASLAEQGSPAAGSVVTTEHPIAKQYGRAMVRLVSTLGSNEKQIVRVDLPLTSAGTIDPISDPTNVVYTSQHHGTVSRLHLGIGKRSEAFFTSTGGFNSSFKPYDSSMQQPPCDTPQQAVENWQAQVDAITVSTPLDVVVQ